MYLRRNQGLEVGVAAASGKALAVLAVVAGNLDRDAILLEGTRVARDGTAATLTPVVTKAGGSDWEDVAKGRASYVAMVEI